MKRWLTRIAYAAGGIVALLLIAIGAAYATSEVKFRKAVAVPDEHVVAATDPASLARGKHLVTIVSKCVECHGEHLQGQAFIDDPVLGRLVAPNLTAGEGGVASLLTDQQIERAIRHGVHHTGRSLKIMPSLEFQYMSDADVSAVIGYLRSLPPVNHDPGTSSLRLARGLYLAGKMPLLVSEQIAAAPGAPMTVAPAPTAEYGGYLAWIGGCKGCHGPTLAGGHYEAGPPDWPPVANLTPTGNIGKWTEEDFVRTLRTGVRPDHSPLNPVMPWKLTGEMSDEELHALWLYLKTLKPLPTGAR